MDDGGIKEVWWLNQENISLIAEVRFVAELCLGTVQFGMNYGINNS